ncbi:uncharacterized protein EAF01_003719 [Botrytis porri]|uniref:uncharacterized protein n=1 Tax=Botrytis porri TaxID=87229 RepID=UPI0019021481|nr:uncharacterized protein EAF01_003719 [Botrytis porri]KAF7910001.1 hypothetical protein EAF01_003719 [Botrytis porri]
MALTTSGFQALGKFDTAGQIDGPVDVMSSTQTRRKSNSQALEQSKVLLARPNLLNAADFESISQLPARELRNDWAGTYRKAHSAQQHPAKRMGEVNDSDEEVLDDAEEEVLWDENLKYKNLGMINVPKGGSPAQKVYNASKFAQEVGNQDVEDFALESDQESSDDDGPELATSMRDAPPPQVQALQAQLGGWDGPLTQYFRGQMESPVRDRYEELIQPIDNAIAAEFDGSTIEGTRENHQAQLQNPFTFAYSIHKSLYMLTMGYKALWRNGTFNSILNGKSENKQKVLSLERLIHSIEYDVNEARFPENFVDAMIPPQIKHLCKNKESIPSQNQNLASASGTLIPSQNQNLASASGTLVPSQNQNLASTSGTLVPSQNLSVALTASSHSSPDQTDVEMANDQNPGQSLTTNQASDQHIATNNQILEETLSQYYDQIGGLNGNLRSYLSQASPKSKQNLSRKIIDVGNQFLKICERHGFDGSKGVVTEEHLQIAEGLEKQLTEAKEVYLKNSGEENLRSLEKIQGEIRHQFPESLAIAIIGGDRNISPVLENAQTKPAGPTTDNQQISIEQKYENLRAEYYTTIKNGDHLSGYLYADDNLLAIAAKRKLETLADEFQSQCNNNGFDAKQDIIDDNKLVALTTLSNDIEKAKEVYLKDLKDVDFKHLQSLWNEAEAEKELADIVRGDYKEFLVKLDKRKKEPSPRFTSLVGEDSPPRVNDNNLNSRFVTPTAWKSPPGIIIDNGIEKKIVGFRSVGNGEQLLLEWRNHGAERNAFELVASSVYKGKRKEYSGGKMAVGTKYELENYSLRDCGFGGVAQVRRRDTTTSYIRAPPTYIFISHKGDEKWFTKSDMIAKFGDQIKDAIEDYNKEAHQTQVTGNRGWKNSRHNGWKDSSPLNDNSKNSTWDDYVISHSRGHGAKENIISNDSSPVMDEQEMYEKFKQFLKTGTGWA